MAEGKSMEWLLKIEDRLSEPASNATKKLEALEKRLRGLEDAERSFSDPAIQRNIASKMRALKLEQFELRGAVAGETQHAGGLRSLLNADAVLDIAGWVGWVGLVVGGVEVLHHMWERAKELTVEFVKTGLEVAQVHEHMATVYEAMTGSKERGLEMLEGVSQLSAQLKFSTTEAHNFAQQLLSAGFAAADVPVYLQALSDAAAATGASTERVEGAVGALRRLNAEGTLTKRTMAVLAAAGIPASGVYEVLAKDLHVTADEARGLVKAGKINANEGAWAIVGAVRTRRSGEELGARGKMFAEDTLEGLKKNFSDFKERLFEGTFLTPGFEAFKGFWRNINEAINPESPTGRRVKDLITGSFSRMMASIFGPLSGEGGLNVIEGIISRVVNVVELSVLAFRSLFNVIEGIGSGYLKSLGSDAASIFGPDGHLSQESMDRIALGAERLGESLGRIAGFLDRILGISRGLSSVAEGTGGGLLGTAFNLAFPSFGQAGAAMGLLENMGAEPDISMIPDPQRAAEPRSGSGSHGPVNVHTNVSQSMTFHGNAEPAEVRSAAREGAQDGSGIALEDLAFAVQGGTDG